MAVNKIPWIQVTKYAETMDLDPDHIAACILVESSGEPFSSRFEPGYKYLWHPRIYAERLNQSVETETTHQQTSWGYMHIMGANAREYGFEGFLPELTGADLGLKYGCIHLKNLLRKYPDIYDAIAAYNAGSVRKTSGGMYTNQKHVDRFHRWLLKLKDPSSLLHS